MDKDLSKQSQLHKAKISIENNKKQIQTNFINNKIMPGMNKFANQRHLIALRNAVVANIPLIMIGAFFMIILNFPIGTKDGAVLSTKMPVLLKDAFTQVFRMTMGLMALVTSFCIGSELAKSYKLDPTTSGTLTLTAFMIWVGVDLATGTISIANLGSKGLFVAIISGIVMFEFYRLCKKYNFTIRLPRQVPAAVSNSFIILIPLFIYILIVMVIRFVANFDFINDLGEILKPIQGALTDNLGGTMLTVFLITFFWFFGLSGESVVGSVIRPFWTTAIEQNTTAFNNGEPIPNAYPEQFLQWGVWIGGSGATIGLVIAALLFARSKQLRTISKTSIIPGVFNINEPVIFGFPIMLNIYLAIPFIFIPQIAVLLNVLWVKLFVIKWVALSPWTLPGPIGAVLATGINPWGWVPSVSTIILATAGYAPFMLMYDKQLVKREELETGEKVSRMNFFQHSWAILFNRKALDVDAIKKAKADKVALINQVKQNKQLLKSSAIEQKNKVKQNRLTQKTNYKTLIEQYKTNKKVLDDEFKMKLTEFTQHLKDLSIDKNSPSYLAVQLELIQIKEVYWSKKAQLSNDFYAATNEILM